MQRQQKRRNAPSNKLPEMFISCPENLESLLCEELRSLGIKELRKGVRGVFTPVSMDAVYMVNYCSRLAIRVLYPLLSFPCRDRDDLYQGVREIPWLHFIKPDETLSIDANVNHPSLRNSLFAAQTVKDAICDQIREKTGKRPSVDTKNPDVQLNLFIHYNVATLSFDTSGSPLFKRGWRSASTVTSIQENLEAALHFLSDFNKETILCDPLCGSGTFLVEAAMIATRTPSGYFRSKWGFSRLPQFDPAKWESFKASKDAHRIPLEKGRLFGADKDLTAIQICKDHLRKIGCLDQIPLQHCDIVRYTPPSSPNLILTDPPYGKRLETSAILFQEIGSFIKKTSSAALILAPDSRYIEATGLTIRNSFPFSHGGLEIKAFHTLA
ncbi:MAG: class I SAM-dependent RNA methyltransferase [Chlamydiales bacterium]|nr:class I SAM-dependent RNA methyltransferase [Chlamydiales bacterium]